MKKVLALVLAVAMVMGLSSVAFASSLLPLKLNNAGASSLFDFAVWFAGSGYAANKSYIDLEEQNVAAPYLYTFGIDDVDEKSFNVYTAKGDKLRADVNEGTVAVTTRDLGVVSVGYPVTSGTPVDVQKWKVTIKAKAGVRDFDLDDFKVELDVGNNVYYIQSQVAYSDTQDVDPDDRLTVKKSNGTKDGTTGSIFNFDEVIDEETRINCNDYVDVYFKGNYGTDKENMRVIDDDDDLQDKIETYFDDVDVDVYDFVGTPKFATKVKVIIDGDKNAILYEYDKKTGDITKVDAEYTSDGWEFTSKNLGCYILTEEEYEDGNIEKEDTVEESSEPEKTTGKDNPGTGANDMVGAAAAMAVVSLVAAGAVAFKKASK